MNKSENKAVRAPLPFVRVGITVLSLVVLTLVYLWGTASDAETEMDESGAGTLLGSGLDQASGDRAPSKVETQMDRRELETAPVPGVAPPAAMRRQLLIVAIRSDVTGRVAGVETVFTPLTPESVVAIESGTRDFVTARVDGEVVRAVTDGKGEAKVSLAATSAYLVRVEASGLLSMGFPALLDLDATELRVSLAQSLRLEGRVLSPEGQGLAGARVYFCAKVLRPGSVPGLMSVGASRSDSAGRFVLETKKQLWGQVHVSVSHRDYPTRVVPVPDQRASASLIVQMEAGIGFRFRILDSQGHAIPGANMRVTQGLYTQLLDYPPGGPELGGQSMGLKILLNQKADKDGVVEIPGWPRGVPAWFQVFTPIRGAKALPRWEFKRAKPDGRLALPGIFEVIPEEGRLYDILVDTSDATYLSVKGRAPGLSQQQKKVLRIYMEYGEGFRRLLWPLRWKGDAFAARLDFLRRDVEKNMPPKDRRRPFEVKACVSPYSENVQLFGPYQLLRDREIEGLLVIQDRIFPETTRPRNSKGGK